MNVKCHGHGHPRDLGRVQSDYQGNWLCVPCRPVYSTDGKTWTKSTPFKGAVNEAFDFDFDLTFDLDCVRESTD